MRPFSYRLIASTVLALLPQTGCETFCNNALCFSEVTAVLPIDREPSALEGAIVQLCRNGSCSEHVMRFEPGTDELDDATAGTVNCGDQSASCFGSVRADGSTELRVSFHLGDGGDDIEVDDGDVYSVTVTAPENPDLVLASREAPVEYRKNDSSCDSVCYTAEL